MDSTNSTAPRRTSVAVVTDSVAQIPSSLAEQWHIRVVPAILIVAGQQYQDGVTLHPEELYRRMRQEKLLPKTAAPSVGAFYEAFASRLREGYAELVYIGLSSRLSGVFASAASAAKMIEQDFPQGRVHLFDSRIATIAQGFIALEAARMAAEGFGAEAILQRVEEMRHRTGLFVTLETLEYLALGGRIGKAAYLLGNMAKIKPVISIGEDGLVEPIGGYVGQTRALEEIVSRVAEVLPEKRYLRLGLLHADAGEAARQLERLALARLHPDEFTWSTFTPVMGAHTGPGVVGLAYQYDLIE